MMPVAGQDAVLNAAPIQRKTHMRAAIVEREDMPALVDGSTTVSWREPCGDSWSRGDEDPLPLFCLPASARGPALCDGPRYTRRAPHNALGNRTHRLHRQV